MITESTPRIVCQQLGIAIPTGTYLSPTIDLLSISNALVMVSVTAAVSAPNLSIYFDVADEAGPAANWTWYSVSSQPIGAALTSAPNDIFGNASSGYVFPRYGRVRGVCTGGSFTGVNITVYGR